MGFYNDIQTIAKTKELTEKVDKAITVAEEAAKEAIGVKRTTVIQTGSGLPFQDTGNNGSGATQPGTDINGNPIEGPLAPAPVPSKSDPTQQHTTDGKPSSDANSGGDTKDVPKDNDKSGSTSSNGNGRGPSKDQADPSSSSVSADIDSIVAAMTANGASPEEIAKAVQKYLQHLSDPGVNEISDVYNGYAGYTPTAGNWTSIAPNTGEYTEVTSSIEKIRAVVGKIGSSFVRINIDGIEPGPTLDESTTAGQGEWVDPITPPLLAGWEYWQAGYWYQSSGTYAVGTYDGATKYLAAKAVAEASIGYVSPGFGYTLTAYRNLTVIGDELSTGDYHVEFYLDWPGVGDGWIDNVILCYKKSCTSDPNIPVCPIAAAAETAWPPIGMWMLTKGATGFGPNQYDSEVPLAYQNTSIGKIVLDSAITGESYSVSAGANGGTIIANETTPNYFLYFGADRTLKTVAPMAYLPFYKAKAE